MPNLFIFSLISSNFRVNVVCSGKHRPFSYELCHFARHFSLEKFRLVENRLKGGKPCILYGLAKVHREDFPTRSIISAIGKYYYRFAAFCVPMLHPFPSNNSSSSL